MAVEIHLDEDICILLFLWRVVFCVKILITLPDNPFSANCPDGVQSRDGQMLLEYTAHLFMQSYTGSQLTLQPTHPLIKMQCSPFFVNENGICGLWLLGWLSYAAKYIAIHHKHSWKILKCLRQQNKPSNSSPTQPTGRTSDGLLCNPILRLDRVKNQMSL